MYIHVIKAWVVCRLDNILHALAPAMSGTPQIQCYSHMYLYVVHSFMYTTPTSTICNI